MQSKLMFSRSSGTAGLNLQAEGNDYRSVFWRQVENEVFSVIAGLTWQVKY